MCSISDEELALIRKKEEEIISRISGRKAIQCSCQKCKEQCKTPCLGTPSDILALLRAGYKEVLKPTLWMVHLVVGIRDFPEGIAMIQLEDNKGCVLNENGMCKIHNTGLKPLEGKLSSHLIMEDNFNFSKSLSWNIAKLWTKEENANIIEEIIKFYK